MTTDNKKIIFNGGPFQSYWWADEHEPVHLTIKAELDAPVDPDALEKSWEKTKKVYPLIDLFPDDLDEEVIFYSSEGESRPVQSRGALKLMTGATFYRSASLTYFDSIVALSIYHSIADERGLTEILKTLLYFYFSDRAGESAAIPGVMTAEGREPGEYFVQNTMLSEKDYIPRRVKLYHNISEIFTDTGVENDENCAVTAGELEISAADMEKLGAETGAGCDEIFACAMAKTIYTMFPDEQRKLSFGMMTDFREVFGIPDTIAPCMKKMPLVLTREDVMGADTNTALKRISDIRRSQKSGDYVKTHVALENTYGMLNLRNLSLALGFSGEFDLGAYTDRIRNISMTDYSIRTAFLIRLGDTVKVTMQYGKATDSYMTAVADTLNGLGVKARVTAKAYPIFAETEDRREG